MAVELLASNKEYLTASGTPYLNAEGPYTVCFWAYFNNKGGGLFTSASSSFADDLQVNIDGYLQIYTFSGIPEDTQTGVVNLDTGVWYFISLIRSSSTQLDAYIDCVLDVSSTMSGDTRTVDTQVRRFGIISGLADSVDGRLAGIKCWNAALSVAELRREMGQIKPVKPALFWYPLLSNNTLKDYGSGASDLSSTNGYALADSPAVAFSSQRFEYHVQATVAPENFSPTVRNAWLDSIETSIGTAPVLEIRTGTQPTNCAASDTGTLLVSVTLPSDWLANASSGTKSKTGTWQANASSAGTAGHFRIKQSGTCHIQGSITAAGGGGDMILDNLSIGSGQTFVVSAATIAST